MNRVLISICVKFFALLLTTVSVTSNADYSKHADADALITTMVDKHQFDRSQVETWLAAAKHQSSIVKAMSRPAEKAKPWHEYRGIFISDTRISRGVTFWQENQKTLARAEKEFGVDPAIIVSIMGIETNYGRNVGSYRVVDALATLAFDYYTEVEKRESRRKFFTTQLEHLFLLAKEQGKDPLTLKGSYAGAMGWGQFMPNSYRNYAVDFDDDQFADIWANPTDAIGSVANYFTKHGWKTNQPVATKAMIEGKLGAIKVNSMRRPTQSVKQMIDQGYRPIEAFPLDMTASPIRLEAKYGQEYWLGFHNFYVIGRYNPRTKYAMAVFQLSQILRQEYCKTTNICVQPDD